MRMESQGLEEERSRTNVDNQTRPSMITQTRIQTKQAFVSKNRINIQLELSARQTKDERQIPNDEGDNLAKFLPVGMTFVEARELFQKERLFDEIKQKKHEIKRNQQRGEISSRGAQSCTTIGLTRGQRGGPLLQLNKNDKFKSRDLEHLPWLKKQKGLCISRNQHE